METTPTTAAVPLAAPRRLAETQPLSSTATDAHQRLDGSVPLRMPAILRLQQPKGGAAPKRDSKGNESVDDARRKAARPGHGKRRQRRYENGEYGIRV
jgi:hypothetical protein